MAKRQNRYEKLTRLSWMLAGVSLVCVLTAAVGIFQKFNWSDFEIVLKTGGLRFLGIVGASGVAIVSAALGFYFAFQAIHRLNPNVRQAWTGFAINALLLALALSQFVFFWLTKETIRIKT